jgi:hypothetical protein
VGGVGQSVDAGAGGGIWLIQAAVAAIAFLEFYQGFEQAGAVEIGPQRFADVHFGVGDLPEEEIAYPHFSAGADEQIGVRQAFGVQITGDFIFGDALEMAVAVDPRVFARFLVFLFRGHMTVASGGGVTVSRMAARLVTICSVAGALREDRVHGVDDFRTAAVVEGDAQAHAGVCGGLLGGLAYVFLHAEGKLVDAAQKAHANIIPLDERHFFADIFAQELHEEIGFNFGAAPILDGKSVERQRFDVEPCASFNGGASCLGAVAVTSDSRKMAALRPAAVAIHDNRHMAWHAGEVEQSEQLGLLHAQWTEGLWSANSRWRELFGVWHGDRREVPGRFPFTAQS